MAKKSSPRLLASELEIIEMLWRVGSVTIVEGQRALNNVCGYTTVQTRLNRMVSKGIVTRSKTKPARYSAALTRAQVASGDLLLLLQKVSSGSVLPLMAHLIKDRLFSPEEIEELRQLVSAAEQAQPKAKKD